VNLEMKQAPFIVSVSINRSSYLHGLVLFYL